jgi:hypothetical protein
VDEAHINYRNSSAKKQPKILCIGELVGQLGSLDDVATIVIGFDPTIEYPQVPLLHAQNYLNMKCDLGWGSNELDKVEVVDVPIDEMRFDFSPSPRQSDNDYLTVQVM